MRRRKLSVRVGAIILSATMLVTSVTPAVLERFKSQTCSVPRIKKNVAPSNIYNVAFKMKTTVF